MVSTIHPPMVTCVPDGSTEHIHTLMEYLHAGKHACKHISVHRYLIRYFLVAIGWRCYSSSYCSTMSFNPFENDINYYFNIIILEMLMEIFRMRQCKHVLP